MKQFLLAIVLIALPVGIFSAVIHWSGDPQRPDSAGLGDLSAYAAIVSDVQGLAIGGDLEAAKGRIADLETAWDDAEPTLRPVNTADWGAVDDSIDAALSALRAEAPSKETVTGTLAALALVLKDPGTAEASGGTGQIVMVEGTATTDATGHAIPCEELLATLREKSGATTLSAESAAKVADLQSKATERCNADDDARSDAFSAQALAVIGL